MLLFMPSQEVRVLVDLGSLFRRPLPHCFLDFMNTRRAREYGHISSKGLGSALEFEVLDIWVAVRLYGYRMDYVVKTCTIALDRLDGMFELLVSV